MSSIPTLEQVRAWIQVPATALSDQDLEQIRVAELEIQARTCRVPASPFVVIANDLTVTGRARGQVPGSLYRIAWGDGYSAEVVIDTDGNATVEHTYAEEGTYTAVLYNASANVLAYYTSTLPTDGVLGYDYPAALSRALLRRCQREVAARAVPLGALGAEGAEYGPITLPRWDAEIVRLEATYRIPVIA